MKKYCIAQNFDASYILENVDLFPNLATEKRFQNQVQP